MIPPPAEGLATRLFVLPALRTQPDRRLITLVRDGYDTAFEEIVRRYGKALTRYAAAIVGSRSEDVTQDAFSKALLALRRDTEAEIDLKPWLYRIVRNTALNDLRDRPPDSAELTEGLGGGSRSAAEEAERREEIAELMQRLRDLPEPQRAAIVMRELEGLSHDEIASALGLSGGGARQTIYRARRALRDGLGLAIPLPLLRTLIEHGSAELSAGAAAAGAGGAAVAMGGAGAGAGVGTALKVGVVTAVLAGSVGTGLAIKENRVHDRDAESAAAATVPGADGGKTRSASSAAAADSDAVVGSRSGPGEGAGGDSSGPGGGSDDNRGELGKGEDTSGEGPSRDPEPGDDRGSSHSGPGPSQDVSGHSGPGSGGGGSGPGGGDRESSGSGSSGSGSSGDDGLSGGSGSSGSGSGGGPGPSGSPPPPPPEGDSSGPGSDGSGSSGSGSGTSGSGTDGLLLDP